MKTLCDKKDLLRKPKEELVDELYDSLVEIEKLRRELLKYKNPNTPPSANPHLKPCASRIGDVKPHKRGAPVGHAGITKPYTTPDEPIHITCKECPNCSGNDILILKQKHQQQEEMPSELRTHIVDITRDVCKCNKCGLKFIARDGKTPIQGRFGINLIVLVLFLKFIVRSVLRKATSFLEVGFAMKLTPASVYAIVQRAAEAGENEYQQLKGRIKQAKLLYVDETSFSVLGRNWWVWVFRSDSDLMFVIRNSRGNNVLDEILGKGYTGTVVCDCWRAYDFLSNATLQRCWAHLLRKSKVLNSVAGKHLHKQLSRMFEQIVSFNATERTEKQRCRKYTRMTAKLKKLTAYYARYDDCEEVVKYIDFHIGSWLTCIKIAGVQPTNNYAEQAIRETVLVRKIIGAFRSKEGTKTYETLASLIATWQYRKLDVRAELYRMLSANLC